MIKFGFSKISQLSEGMDFKGFFGGQKKISVTLYDRLDGLPDQKAIEERILFLFADELGAYKRTYGSRFVDFDRKIIQQMEAHFSPSELILVEDVAVSNARTSCDFFKMASIKFPLIHMNATDYDPYVYVIEKGSLKLTVSSKCKLLEIVCPPFVLNEIKLDSYLYFINHLVRAVIKCIAVKPLLDAYKSKELLPHRIALFCQEAQVLVNKDGRFTLGQHNLLEKFPDGCNASVVRAMNILNPEYFDIEQLRIVLINIFDALREGGLFVFGSNFDAGTIVNGGIFKKQGKRFQVLELSGDGPPGITLELIKGFGP